MWDWHVATDFRDFVVVSQDREPFSVCWVGMQCLSACYAWQAQWIWSDCFTIGVMGMLQGKGIGSVKIMLMTFFEFFLAEHHREGAGCSTRCVQCHPRQDARGYPARRCWKEARRWVDPAQLYRRAQPCQEGGRREEQPRWPWRHGMWLPENLNAI